MAFSEKDTGYYKDLGADPGDESVGFYTDSVWEITEEKELLPTWRTPKTPKLSLAISPARTTSIPFLMQSPPALL